MLTPWKNSYEKPRQCIKKQRHHFANKGPSSQSYGFSRSHVRMWQLNHKEGWAPKNWCFQTVVLEKTLESPLESKEIKPVNPKGNWSWIFIERTDAEAETPILCPADAKSWLIGKDLDAGKDWRQKVKRAAEDEIASPTQWTWVWAEIVEDRGACAWGRKDLGTSWRLNNPIDYVYSFHIRLSKGNKQPLVWNQLFWSHHHWLKFWVFLLCHYNASLSCIAHYRRKLV